MSTVEIEVSPTAAALLNYAMQLDYASQTLTGSARYNWINAELRHIKSPSEPSKTKADLFNAHYQPSASDRVIGRNAVDLRRYDYAPSNRYNFKTA